MKNLGTPFVVTEKLDAENISVYKVDGEIYVAFRKNIYTLDEVMDESNKALKEYHEWFAEHGADLKKKLYEGSCIHGEWLKRGVHIRDYKKAGFDKDIYLFAKSRIGDDGKVERLNYNLDELKYPFDGAVIPDYIGVVPKVAEISEVPTKAVLNKVYA